MAHSVYVSVCGCRTEGILQHLLSEFSSIVYFPFISFALMLSIWFDCIFFTSSHRNMVKGFHSKGTLTMNTAANTQRRSIQWKRRWRYTKKAKSKIRLYDWILLLSIHRRKKITQKTTIEAILEAAQFIALKMGVLFFWCVPNLSVFSTDILRIIICLWRFIKIRKLDYFFSHFRFFLS